MLGVDYGIPYSAYAVEKVNRRKVTGRGQFATEQDVTIENPTCRV